MSAFMRSRYGYAPSEYEEDDEQGIHKMHPEVKREALRIARRERLWKLRQWWLSTVGIGVLLSALVSVLLGSLGFLLQAGGAFLPAALGTLYLLGLALRPRIAE